MGTAGNYILLEAPQQIGFNYVVDHFHTKINHIHVKETAKKGITQFVRFGEGITDNNRFIERIIKHGYSGYISVELAIEDKSNILHDLEVPYNLFSKYEI